MEGTNDAAATGGEVDLHTQIRQLIVGARRTIARGVDVVQVRTNFEIGRHIVEREQQGEARASYGAALLQSVSKRLVNEFGNGFSKRNLELMRRFFVEYRVRYRIAQTVSAQLHIGDFRSHHKNYELQTSATADDAGMNDEGMNDADVPFTLSWSHYILLVGIANVSERRFYEIESTSCNWSVRELKRQYNSGLYERLALSRDKDGIRKLAQVGQVVEQPKDLLKQPLVLEFLGLDNQSRHSESDLEAAIISNVEKFLLELGKGFLFEARQKRFTVDDEDFFVDLVFYNRLLRCYVLIDLKIGKLTHQDLGQMQMYVNSFDRFVKTQAEHCTIGIILCKQRREALVEITLPHDANIQANEYQLYLPSKEQLQQKLQEWGGQDL